MGSSVVWLVAEPIVVGPRVVESVEVPGSGPVPEVIVESPATLLPPGIVSGDSPPVPPPVGPPDALSSLELMPPLESMPPVGDDAFPHAVSASNAKHNPNACCMVPTITIKLLL